MSNLTARLREQLAYGPCSAREMAKRLNEPERAVASRLSQLLGRPGTRVLVFDRQPTRYVLASWLDTRRRPKGEPPRKRVNVAGPIVIPQYRWGSTRLA